MAHTLVILLFLLPLAFAGNPFNSLTEGLTFKPCFESDDCRGERECLSTNGRSRCRKEDFEDEGCNCIPEEFIGCAKDNDCPRGEFCARYSNTPLICMAADLSARSVEDLKDTNFGGYNDCINASPEPASGDRLTYDSCENSSQCSGERVCLDAANDLSCCDGEFFRGTKRGCLCFPKDFTFCTRDDDCENGEECVDTRRDPPRCMSSNSVDELDADGVLNWVCVDAEALSHIPRRELAYRDHRWASVLCDEQGSCATPGHMVLWKERAIMMRTYCEQVGCETKVIRVNSPKYKKGLVVKTKTEGLGYLVFAARYETKIEEGVLAAAVRMGM